MKILIKFFNSLRKDPSQDPREVHLPAGATVRDLLAGLELDPDEVGILVINGKRATFTQPLQENDLVTCIPHIGGG